MSSLILARTSEFFKPLLLVVSIVILLRGHHEPGGGFVGGLLAAAAFSLEAIAKGFAAARRSLRVEPHALLGVGLLTALGSGVVAMASGAPLLTARWAHFPLPLLGEVKVSTVLLFDTGIYLVVLGTVMLMIFTLGEESK